MPAPLPSNLCDHSYRGSPLDRIYEALGLKSRSMPKPFKGLFNVDGHTVVVFPSRAGTEKSRFGYNQRKYRKKTVSGRKYGLTRVFFRLPGGKLVPAGRIKQSGHCGGKGGRARKR